MSVSFNRNCNSKVLSNTLENPTTLSSSEHRNYSYMLSGRSKSVDIVGREPIIIKSKKELLKRANTDIMQMLV
jgi:hypothetical protein